MHHCGAAGAIFATGVSRTSQPFGTQPPHLNSRPALDVGHLGNSARRNLAVIVAPARKPQPLVRLGGRAPNTSCPAARPQNTILPATQPAGPLSAPAIGAEHRLARCYRTPEAFLRSLLRAGISAISVACSRRLCCVIRARSLGSPRGRSSAAMRCRHIPDSRPR